MDSRTNILNCLRYFSFFNHPLKADEIHRYLDVKMSFDDCQKQLVLMAKSDMICSDGVYYSLKEQDLKNRNDNEKLNSKLLSIGRVIGRFVGLFPFVRGVYVSGSLSKFGANGIDDDIDFFIITERNRLWTARLFLILFKKAFLFNSKKYFCINFFKANDDLVLTKKNRYIATEAVSLIPIVNHELLKDLYKKNDWINEAMPNAKQYFTRKAKPTKKLPWMEFLLKGRVGNVVEDKAFLIFEKHQKAKYKNHQSAEIVATKSTSALFPNSVEKDVLSHLKK